MLTLENRILAGAVDAAYRFYDMLPEGMPEETVFKFDIAAVAGGLATGFSSRPDDAKAMQSVSDPTAQPTDPTAQPTVFSPGDVVRLKSGGPLMNVAVVAGNVLCVWIDGEKRQGVFPPECLDSYA